jgi:hypothetical protein
MRVALALLPIAAVVGSSCGGNTERAVVTVMPENGPGVVAGWSMPVQLTVAQHGKRLTDFPLGHAMDIEIRPGSYVFALYDKACPQPVKVYQGDHLLLRITLYDDNKCEMSLSLPLFRGNLQGQSGPRSRLAVELGLTAA